jgi:hypothetical protein
MPSSPKSSVDVEKLERLVLSLAKTVDRQAIQLGDLSRKVSNLTQQLELTKQVVRRQER